MWPYLEIKPCRFNQGKALEKVILNQSGPRNQMSDLKGTKKDTEKQKKGGSMKTEAEIRIMPPQTKECQQPPEAGGGKEKLFPRIFKGSMALSAP